MDDSKKYLLNANKYGIYFNINNKDYGIFFYDYQLLSIILTLLFIKFFIKNKNQHNYSAAFAGAISYWVIKNNFFH